MFEYEEQIAGIVSGRFDAEARDPVSGRWHRLFVGDAASQSEDAHRNGGAEGFVSWAADREIRVRLRFPAPVRTAKLRPSLVFPLPVAVSGNTVEADIPASWYGILEVNMALPETSLEPVYTVYLFADRPQPGPLTSTTGREITPVTPGFHDREQLSSWHDGIFVFEPGLHEVEGGEIELYSRTELFLKRGAVIRGGLHSNGAEETTVSGQGIFDGSFNRRPAGVDHLSDDGRPGFFCFFGGRNLTVDGPMIYNPSFWNIVPVGVEYFTLRNHKALSWIVNNDGIQPRSCNHFLAEHCFLKCNDDGVAIKTRRKIGMHSHHQVYRDLVIWGDKFGNALEIGHSSQGDLLEKIEFRDIAVIRGNHRAAVDICLVDHSLLRDVIYENIHVEGKPAGWDFYFSIPGLRTFASDTERGRIEKITVRNYYSEHEPRRNGLMGADADHLISDVRFDNLVFHAAVPELCRRIESLDELNLELVFTENIKLVHHESGEIPSETV